MLLKNIFAVFWPLVLGTIASTLFNHFHLYASIHWAWSLLFFGVISVLANAIYTFQSKAENFTEVILGGIVVRLIAGFFCIFLYALYRETTFISFAAHFLVHYVLFTIFEVRYLFFLIKQQSPHAI
jgi:cobalamin biosynthesis protein CobD/CbiB